MISSSVVFFFPERHSLYVACVQDRIASTSSAVFLPLNRADERNRSMRSVLVPFYALLVLLTTSTLVSSAKLSVSFCPANEDSRINPPNSESIRSVQPSTQLERFTSITYDAPSLMLLWSPSEPLCGQRMANYYVSVTSSFRMIQPILKLLGGFPQNTCSGSEKNANQAMKCGDGPCNACAEVSCGVVLFATEPRS